MELFITPIQPLEKMDFSKGREVSSEEPSGNFENFLNNALQQLEETTEASTVDGYNLALGDTDDLAQLQINGMKATAMIQTAVQLTTRAVNAYKEIMQMQI